MLKFLFFILNLLLFYLSASADNFIRKDFILTLKDGTILDCSKFIPNSALQNTLFPAIIYCHGFGGSKDDMIPFAKNWSEEGYYVLTYSMRGHGKSTGLSNFISRIEMNDLFDVLKYVKSERNVDTAKIGIIGSSQGGIIPLMAVSYGLKVTCIISDLTVPDFASNWIENGCVKMTLLWSLSYDTSIVRYSPKIKKFRKWILSSDPDKWDSLFYNLPRNRDFVNKMPDISTPFLISNSWQDAFFNSAGLLKTISSIKTNYRFYLGAIGGHGSDTSFYESVYHGGLIYDWFNHWLKDNLSVTDNYPVIYASSTNPVNYNHWSYIRYYTDLFPPDSVTYMKLYFQPDNKLTFEPNESNIDTVSILNDVVDKSLTMRKAVNWRFTGHEFFSKFEKNYIYFETNPLDRDYKLTGIPLLNLVYSSNASVCQFNFQIWEVSPDNTMNFVNRINFTDRHYKIGLNKSVELEGIALSHIFNKGNRIRIYVTNIDNGPYNELLGTNPFVLPVLEKGRHYIYMNSKQPSFISLPIHKF